jgi:hypothetical protein
MLTVLVLAGFGSSQAATNPTPYTCDYQTVKFHLDRTNNLLKKGYDTERWKDKTPLKNKEKSAIQDHKFCLVRKEDRARVENQRERYSEKFAEYRADKMYTYRLKQKIIAITPYECTKGIWGRSVIPCYIIACESRYSWSAANPSGAIGWYQFLGWNVPWPVDSLEDVLAHHRQAAGMSLSNWVCA